MQSAELLEQTASERLTLEQEYDMQRSWFQDENSKDLLCSFFGLIKNHLNMNILCDRVLPIQMKLMHIKPLDTMRV